MATCNEECFLGADPEFAMFYEKLLMETRIVSLDDAIAKLGELPDLDLTAMQKAVQKARELMRNKVKDKPDLKANKYSVDHAAALNLWSRESPPIYKKITGYTNGALANRTSQLNGKRIPSAELEICAPFIKLIDIALVSLPRSFLYEGPLPVWRGIDWLYPSPEDHDVSQHFPIGRHLFFYELKASSLKREVAEQQFARVGPKTKAGTLICIKPCESYRIQYFSDSPNEHEVLFRPMSKFIVESTIGKPYVVCPKPDMPQEVHLKQERSLQKVVLFGEIGSGKTRIFQKVTGRHDIGTVSSGQESVLAFNEAWTRGTEFLVRDVPGTASTTKVATHIGLQLRALAQPNHCLSILIKADERVDMIWNEICSMYVFFKQADDRMPDGVCFIVSKCDKMDWEVDDKTKQKTLAGMSQDEWERTAMDKIQRLADEHGMKGFDAAKQILFTNKATSFDTIIEFWKKQASTYAIIFKADKEQNVFEFFKKYSQAIPLNVIKTSDMKELESKAEKCLKNLSEISIGKDDAKVLKEINAFHEHVTSVKERLAKACREGLLNDLDDTQMRCLYAFHDEANDKLATVRYEGFKKMSFDPQNSADPNNWFRRCHTCGICWTKTSGCSSTTTCGARDLELDCRDKTTWKVTDSLKHWYEGRQYKPLSGDEAKMVRGEFIGDPKCVKNQAVGCGATLLWDQLPPAFSQAELAMMMKDSKVEFYESSIYTEVKDALVGEIRDAMWDQSYCFEHDGSSSSTNTASRTTVQRITDRACAIM